MFPTFVCVRSVVQQQSLLNKLDFTNLEWILIYDRPIIQKLF